MENRENICPVCEIHFFEDSNDFDICPVCGWENDGVQRGNYDYWGGANSLSVNASKKVYFLINKDGSKEQMIKLLEQYKEKKIDIYKAFKGINHMSARGKMFTNAFRKINKDFDLDLNKLYNKYH